MSSRSLLLASVLLILVVPVSSGLVGVEPKVSPPAGAHASLGISLAADGDWAAAGAPSADGPLWDNVGEVHLMHRGPDGWTPAGAVADDGLRYGARFGASVDLDGDLLVVGAPGDDTAASQAGAAYVFRRAGDAWVQEAKLTEPRERTMMGASVAVADGTVVVGAYGWNDFAGGVFVYEHDGGAWTRTATFTTANTTYDGQLGTALAFDGRRIVAGAPTADGASDAAGAVYVFERRGKTWHESVLWAEDGVRNDHFGTSVALEGHTIVAGAVVDTDGAWQGGSAYVFRQHGNRWAQEAKLVPPDLQDRQMAGGAVAVAWPWVAVGSHRDREGGGNSGAVYLYSAQDWDWSYKLRGDGGADQFGASLALDAQQLLVGAPSDDGAGQRSGSVFVFDMDCGPELLSSRAWVVSQEDCAVLRSLGLA